MPDMKECFSKHVVLHSLTGLGVGFVLISLIPSLAENALLIGVVAIVAGIGLEMVLGQK